MDTLGKGLFKEVDYIVIESLGSGKGFEFIEFYFLCCQMYQGFVRVFCIFDRVSSSFSLFHSSFTLSFLLTTSTSSYYHFIKGRGNICPTVNDKCHHFRVGNSDNQIIYLQRFHCMLLKIRSLKEQGGILLQTGIHSKGF